MRTIMLIDMDYFFAACEEIKRPELKKRPTVVGADPKMGRGRGVVMTCNYIARKYGIRSGMPISAAYRLKPDAEFLPLDYSYYEKKSAEVMSIIRGYSAKMEQVSIDEAFIDASGNIADSSGAMEYAKKIKKSVREKAGLPCSIGIGPSRLIAKMACEDAKPDGIRLVDHGDEKAFISGMPVGRLYGIGRKSEERLAGMGYDTVGKLANANIMELMDAFGSFGVEMHKYANGIDESEVVENYEVKSIGRERTFESDTDDREEILRAILELSGEVAAEAAKLGVSFKTITVKMRYSDFSEHMKGLSIRPSSSEAALGGTAKMLYTANVEKGRKLRKIGVRVSGLSDYKSQKRLSAYLSSE